MIVPLNLLPAATFSLLSLAIVSIWVRPWIAIVVLGAATACGYLAGVLYGPAFLWIVLLGLACWAYFRFEKIYKVLSAAILLIMSLRLGLHKVSGFRNPLIAD